MNTIRIGTRDSRLAIVQAEMVRDAILARQPERRVEVVPMKTTGDRILDRALDEIGGKGLFVKELDAALREERVDLCVHSYKDMPAEDAPALPVVAVSARADARDALVLPEGVDRLDPAQPVGCSSERRRLQFEALYDDVRCAPVRGNVLTRLQKLDRGEYGALILAAAGLERLGLRGRIHKLFTPAEMLPCGCQGILAVQARRGEDTSYLAGFHDAAAWDVARAERAFVRALDGGCSSPTAAYGQVAGDQLTLDGLYVDETGRLHRGVTRGPRAEAAALGEQLARQLREQGVGVWQRVEWSH